MSSCKHKLIKYLSGELTIAGSAQFEKHLDECPACRGQYAAVAGYINNLRKSSEIEQDAKLPANFTSTLMYKVDSLKHEPARERVSFNYAPVLKWAAGIAVFVLLFANVLMMSLSKDETIRVRFEIYQPNAQTVSLAGDFNNWNLEDTQLKQNHDGIWRVTLRLKPGQYQYMFLVNGKKWTPDPKSKEYIDDGYGHKNSLIDLI